MTAQGRARLLGTLGVLVVAAILVAAIASGRDGAPSSVAPSAASGQPPDDAVEAAVDRVVDGDTVVVVLEGRRERVRYVGIDAPEIASVEEGRIGECWGEEAARQHAELVDGARLWLARDTSDRDRFDRLLRNAWVRDESGWLHVGQALVLAGAVEARSYPPDTGMDAVLGEAEDAARAAAAGLWGAC